MLLNLKKREKVVDSEQEGFEDLPVEPAHPGVQEVAGPA